MSRLPASLALVAGVLVFAGVPALRAADNGPAGTGTTATSNPRFQRLDADGDGRVSRAEFLASIRAKKNWWKNGERTANTDQNAATPEMFTALDGNRDGYLTREELDRGQRLLESRGDNGPGASSTRNVHPPGDPHGSQKSGSETAADKRVEPSK